VALAIRRRAAPTGIDPVGNPALHIALDPTDRTRAQGYWRRERPGLDPRVERAARRPGAVFARTDSNRWSKSARPAGLAARKGTGYPLLRAFACVRGAARAQPWISPRSWLVHHRNPSPITRAATRVLRRKTNFSKHRFSLEGLLTLGYVRYPRLSLQPADGVTIALYVGWLHRDIRSAARREVPSIPAIRTGAQPFPRQTGQLRAPTDSDGGVGSIGVVQT